MVADATGTTITGLEPNTDYDYQVIYTVNGKEYYMPSRKLTTIDKCLAPFDLSVSDVTSNTATINWSGYADSYNLRYTGFGEKTALVTLSVPDNVWGDGTGYQMLLDPTHSTYGTIIPQKSALSQSDDVSAEIYEQFAYKIPEDADGSLTTQNMIIQNSVTIEIPAGIYDWCITNPTPDDRMYIAAANSDANIGGRYDDFIFEPGGHYTFTVSLYPDGHDGVQLSVSSSDEWTVVDNISNTSYNLSGLNPADLYCVQVQSVDGDRQSEWISTILTTDEAGNIDLFDNADNSEVIAANDGQTCNVTLVGRTLWKDGSWNTLCLPFDVEIAGSTLDGDGVDVRTLLTSSFAESTGTLTLDFTPAPGEDGAVTEIKAGKPYIIKWNNTGGTINDPEFNNVTIKDTKDDITTGVVDFVGTFSPLTLEANDNGKLYLGADNTLYYPAADVPINSFRAYFQLNGITAGEGSGERTIKTFNLNFGEEETGIIMMEDGRSKMDDAWYSLDGLRIGDNPSRPGLYIHGGQKVLIK